MYKHLLVPLDGTPLASATIEQAVAYARAGGARLTFLHVRADIAARGDGALLHAMSPEVFADAAAGNARALLARAEAAARAGGVVAASMLVTSDRPHEAILEAARSSGCDLVFMASHGRRGLKGALLGSVTRKVLDGATLPVLVAAVESNLAARSDEQRALALLREEHRSLAAVLQAMRDIVDDTAQPPDPALLHAMLFYVEQFPERLHHPKEEHHLFARLRQRTSECDALLAELEQQHESGAGRVAQLRSRLDAGDMAAFAGAANGFAQEQWQHMRAEEALVLPAASRHLLAEDWRAVAEAFEANADPRFGAGESFDALAARLLELAGRRATTGSAA
jgi:nucleotide-binding universal stress UspA family protein/hemerythrin-like domain-containing protein